MQLIIKKNLFFSLKCIVVHEIKMILRESYSWLTPLLFFIVVITFFPLGSNADPIVLHTMAPGIIWIATTLSIVIACNQLFRIDEQEGFLDLLILSDIPLMLLVCAKILSHWLFYCLPLIIMSPLVGFLFDFNIKEDMTLVIAEVLGTPSLILFGGLGSALTIGLKNSGLLLPVLILPFYVPILIFGASAIVAVNSAAPILGYYAILGAFLCLSFAFLPFFIGMALRIGVNQ